ncbi:uncharacterized protein LOC135486099 isoform X1 [Lineus longissimus]|uniref:uncharacterized protein LOC135486099 isoform X1 n=1 Tax=Lineus longissimus TaxID=88925 RepID=UPI002B4CD703
MKFALYIFVAMCSSSLSSSLSIDPNTILSVLGSLGGSGSNNGGTNTGGGAGDLMGGILGGTGSSGGTGKGNQVANQLIGTVKDFAVNIFKGFFGKLFENQIGRNYHDDIIMGRAVRITKVDDTTVTILDRASGVKTTGTGANGQEAIENGTKALLETLLLTGKMSLLDLGIQPAVVTTEQPCYDKHPKSYCEEMEGNGLCSPGHQMATFMKTYCFKTCGGC